MQFLLEVVDTLLNYVRKTFDRSTKVLDFHHPHQLLEGMEGFNLELSDNPESLEQILVDCRDTLKYGVRTGRFSHDALESPSRGFSVARGEGREPEPAELSPQPLRAPAPASAEAPLRGCLRALGRSLRAGPGAVGSAQTQVVKL